MDSGVINYPLDNLNFNREKPDFLEIPTSTSTVARYLWNLSLLHPCITCEFHQITSHRRAVNVFCVHVYFEVLMFCRPSSLQYFVFPHVV